MRGWSGSLVALGAMLAAAGAAAAIVVVLPVDPPAALRTASPAGVVPVTERRDADVRQLQLALDTGAPRAVVTTDSGTVTASSCSTGAPATSGSELARIDGRPVIAFASSTPLWRDLRLDDHGGDVRGLQRELARLGTPVAVDGLVGPATIRAAADFLVRHGVERSAMPEDVIPMTPFAWIPAASVTVRSCAAVVGAPVPEGAVLVELPAELRGARLDGRPSGAAPGARIVRIGSVRAPISEGGVVSDAAALAEIGALPEYDATVASADGVPSLPVSWELADPRTVRVVPPTALWDLRDGSACVQPASGPPALVEVLGSELGQSFVRMHGARPLDRVRTGPDRSASCR